MPSPREGKRDRGRSMNKCRTRRACYLFYHKGERLLAIIRGLHDEIEPLELLLERFPNRRRVIRDQHLTTEREIDKLKRGKRTWLVGNGAGGGGEGGSWLVGNGTPSQPSSQRPSGSPHQVREGSGLHRLDDRFHQGDDVRSPAHAIDEQHKVTNNCIRVWHRRFEH